MWQVRRYVYHDVVRLDDLEKLIDCSYIQVCITSSNLNFNLTSEQKRFTIMILLEKLMFFISSIIEKALFLTWAALYYKQCKGNILESEGTV